MDTTETYIKMCDCEEIQGEKPDGSQGEFVFCEGEAYQEMDDRPLTPFVWLPRQDQLQEMVKCKESDTGLAYRFGKWARLLSDTYTDYLLMEAYMSMEQLWLAFVMKGYNKVWDGEWRVDD